MSRIFCVNINSLECFDYYKMYNKLEPELKKKIDNFKFVADKKRSLLSHFLRLYSISEYFGIDYKNIEFGFNNYGKPLVLNPLNIFFNISHAGDYVMCGVSCKDIGIDIECISEYLDLEVAKRLFMSEEYNIIQNSSNRRETFTKYWTLKEAYIKFLGCGLSKPLNTFGFKIINEKVILIESSNRTEQKPIFKTKYINNHYIYSLCYLDNVSSQIIDVNVHEMTRILKI
ncbi:4'-phosphopantetheinyl transferase family protein [Hungatella hathewayi]|uniref:4'-phosphopantetheinyl transferase family protein n=1 Tax=Hungatella hathewayi TaxID=154046 RepID=UPI00356211C2